MFSDETAVLSRTEAEEETKEQQALRLPKLDKLVLQVSQVCNLSCTYCITQEGAWGKTGQLRQMPPQTVKRTIDQFAGAFEEISVINFFGGEPTLNLPAIEAAGQKVKSLLDSGQLCSRPHLSMATNGMCASEEFVRLVNRYGLRFAVSVDGPAEVNDQIRLTKSGKGSYQRIKENVRKLREATGYPKGIALTYTAAHFSSPLSLWEMLLQMREDFGIWDFAIMPATNSPATPGQWDPLLAQPDRFIEEYQECIRESMAERTCREDAISIEYGKKALAKLIEEASYEECPAGRSYFSVSAEGDVYPCQNLPETPEFRITNIRSERFFDELWESGIRRTICEANAQAKASIGNHESRSMCRICPSDNLGETGSLTTYSPQRFRLYRSIDQTTKETFVQIMSSRDESAQSRLLKSLDR